MSLPDPNKAIKVANYPSGVMHEQLWMYLFSLVTYIRALEARIEALEP